MKNQLPPPQEITPMTPLPAGWSAFCSAPYGENDARWYATAPYLVVSLQGFSKGLVQTVDAPSWTKLHAAVADQVALYEAMVGTP